jgi:hydroxyethylthiazole kinase
MRAPKSATASQLVEAAADVLVRVREHGPRVHCITNTVAQPFTANMLLALGAVPSMTIAPAEIASFVTRADALLVNLGTLDPERREACEIAISEAGAAATPWVLDPVFVDRSEPRAAFAKALLAKDPPAIRLNAAEFATLAGDDAQGDALARFAREAGMVIALTGASDIVDDGMRRAVIANGDALMGKVTAMGCAASAFVAACLAVERDPWRACAAGLVMLGVAGEVAASRARGPGSFAVEIIDAVHHLDRATLVERARVT